MGKGIPFGAWEVVCVFFGIVVDTWENLKNSQNSIRSCALYVVYCRQVLPLFKNERKKTKCWITIFKSLSLISLYFYAELYLSLKLWFYFKVKGFSYSCQYINILTHVKNKSDSNRLANPEKVIKLSFRICTLYSITLMFL